MKPWAFTVLVDLWICCALHPDLAAQTIVAQPQYRFQHLDTKDGLPSAFVGSIAQDHLGFVWFQYYLGLSRFDGYNFKVYRHDPNDTVRSLPRGGIGFVLTDPNGNLWVTPHTRTPEYFLLSKYDSKTDSFIKYRPRVNGTMVSDICFDKRNAMIWFATTGSGLFSFNTETLETNGYVHSHSDSIIRRTRNTMWSISDRDGSILIGSGEGLWKFDKKTKTFGRPKSNSDSASLYNTPIWHIDDGPNNNYNDAWLGLNQKLVNVDENFLVLRSFDFPDGFRPKGYERDKEGTFWFSTWDDQGIYRYSPTDNSLTNIRNIPGDINSLKSNKVNWLKVDRDQNIWIATDLGVSRLPKQRLRFYNFTVPGGMGESTVYHHDENDYLIITRKKNDAQELLIAPLISGRFDSLRFKKITEFKDNLVCGLWRGKRNFWISVHHQGVRGFAISPTTGMISSEPDQLLSHDSENKNTISSNLTTFVWEDGDEILWVGTRNGLNRVNLSIPYGMEGSVIRYEHKKDDPNSLGDDIVWNVYPEDDHAFWVISDTGMDLFENGHFEHFYKGNTAPTLYKTDEGVLYVAAFGGLFDGRKHGDQYRFSQRPLLKIEDVIRMQGDTLGRLWISSAQGIVCFDPHQNSAIRFNEKNGFDHTYAVQPWYREHQTSTGLTVISDLTGISLFNPSSLSVDNAKTFPVLTGLKINNLDCGISSERDSSDEFSISQAVSVLEELVLDYQHNNFAIEFSAMEMTSPDKNVYRHKLDGYDDEWIETDWKKRIATYTNLDAGNYVFRVMATNHHGIWADEETTLLVRILPPPWRTWWAYSLYALAFVGLILSWRRYDIKRVKLKHRAEHLSELDQLKSRFFANISHEFRTPITLILGPLKKLYDKSAVKQDKEELGTMMRNSQRLHRLINQLLDLSKIEGGKMRLHASPVELVEFLREIAASYESLAIEKNLKYFSYPEVDELNVYIDQEKMEKIVHNLLSNAFKFTNTGEVILNLKADKKHCFITVKDTGLGIPSDQLEKVFDRFYQVDSSQTRGYEGSGLGMALAKELVELHKGKISVQSTEGKGTTFTVMLPLGKEHLTKDEITDGIYHTEREQLSDFVVQSDIEEENVTASNGNRPVLLIVEDNSDMRNYIRKTLAGEYQILEAENGKSGVKVAEETIPDLIISDIMMPEMDGYKLCSTIKSNELTSHIPVILLTAKADRESKLSGLEMRADDYFLKPFDADELKLIVRNRIEERKKMRERFSREVTLEPRQISITSLDEKFLGRVLGIIEAHMDDENFSIDELSREAGFSNMHFYRKIKALSGETPSQFLRTIRLKRAAALLAKKSDNVTQVAYAVGFGSLSYFNKCFKEQFGVTPGQYVVKDSNPKT